MKLIIHRGAHEIGGSCVELRTAKSRILIDFGMPLVSCQKEPFDKKILEDKSIDELRELKVLPDIKGLYKNEEKEIDAIFISHAHLDHYGLLNYVHQDIPIYMSEGVKALMAISDIFIPHKLGRLNTSIIHNRRSVNIGDISITPYLVDHSAFDALAFLIEAEGKRLFYSGDFRGHGRKSILFKSMIENPPEDIDCLLMEGSMLGRDKQVYKDEKEVQHRIEEVLRRRNNITFIFVSSQNIDRLVSIYKACLKTRSIFVIDIYTAFVLDKLRKVSKNIPQFNWKNIRVKFLQAHANALTEAGYRDLLFVYNKRKIDIFEINRNKNKILMLGRDNYAFKSILKDIDEVAGATIIYSMWEGYLTEEFRQYCKEKGISIEQVHTSGHATAEDLKLFSNALKPKVLIPIHTFDANRYPSLFKNVKILKDGETLDLG
jgi:ribonuclease J